MLPVPVPMRSTNRTQHTRGEQMRVSRMAAILAFAFFLVIVGRAIFIRTDSLELRKNLKALTLIDRALRSQIQLQRTGPVDQEVVVESRDGRELIVGESKQHIHDSDETETDVDKDIEIDNEEPEPELDEEELSNSTSTSTMSSNSEDETRIN